MVALEERSDDHQSHYESLSGDHESPYKNFAPTNQVDVERLDQLVVPQEKPEDFLFIYW